MKATFVHKESGETANVEIENFNAKTTESCAVENNDPDADPELSKVTLGSLVFANGQPDLVVTEEPYHVSIPFKKSVLIIPNMIITAFSNLGHDTVGASFVSSPLKKTKIK